MTTTIIERKPLAELVPAEYNPRSIQDDALAGLGRSIARFGMCELIVWNRRTNTVVSGHQRLKVLLAQGEDATDVVVVDLPPNEERALNIAMNNPAIAGEFTTDLQALLADLHAADEALFDDLMFEPLVEVDESVPDAPNDDGIEAIESQTRCQLGDLWKLGEHRVFCGDSTDVASYRALGFESFELLVTSPPYNQKIDTFKPHGMHAEGDWSAKVGRLAYSDNLPEGEYQKQQRALLALWYELLADGASVFYNHKNRYRDKRVVSPLEWLPGSFRLRQEIIWARPGSVTQNARMFLPCDERIYWLYRGEDFRFNDTTEIKTWSSIWRIAPSSNTEHAVAFPIELPHRCIAATTGPGDVVLDPFMGSGTTLIAAEAIGRVAAGVEMNPTYVDLTLRRWENMTGGTATVER